MNKRQIKEQLQSRLDDHIQTLLVEEVDLKTKRGTNKKFKGRKQNLKIKDKKRYATTLAPMISGALAAALKMLALESFDYSQTNETKVIKQLNAMLLQSGVKFPVDRDDIKSTELSEADFSQATLTWSSNKIKVEGQFQFPVMGQSEIENAEYGDVDLKKGRIIHTLFFNLSLGKEEITLTGLDVVWK